MISLVFSNASPAMPPWGARAALSWHQPVRGRCPGGTEPPFLLDMSPAVAARGKSAGPNARRDNFRSGYALRRARPPTTDPTPRSAAWCSRSAAYKARPVDAEWTFSAAVISARPMRAASATSQRRWTARRRRTLFPRDEARPFVPEGDYRARWTPLITRVRSSPTAEGFDEVLVAGEPSGATRRCGGATAFPTIRRGRGAAPGGRKGRHRAARGLARPLTG